MCEIGNFQKKQNVVLKIHSAPNDRIFSVSISLFKSLNTDKTFSIGRRREIPNSLSEKTKNGHFCRYGILLLSRYRIRVNIVN